MNQVTLIGRLTRDPELRFTAGSGKAIATFSIAVDRGYGQDKQADFFRIVVWDKQGENCANYLAKGSLVAIQGRLQNNNYEKDGVKHYNIDIVANRVQFLDTKRSRDEQGGFNPSPIEPDGFQAIEDDDDIPF
ncbi:single-stranded DNA-binding protein [Crassaminicella profunda]|jgi:single-strand DNA-binding protein|uniref:single-stranded DNA-binding protein n=1 Tax=Crassaminicella profunda TaxID=1286698 RepID=UPI001CA6D5D8|nr:single-stranded DNA-binding protein [Crassaminicella profunda]QZY55122.1 single-stranded DNA-binding protein [Crassaminicella profunda]